MAKWEIINLSLCYLIKKAVIDLKLGGTVDMGGYRVIEKVTFCAAITTDSIRCVTFRVYGNSR